MDERYWRERWQSGQIGFHKPAPNALLQKHHGLIADRRRVYVPLCGKTRDLAWLRDQGHDVTGSEVVGLAVEQLMKDEQLVPAVTTRGPFRAHITPRLTVLEGDAFALDSSVCGFFDAVFDRAALVALAPDTRRGYADALLRVLRRGGRVLLITFVYDQARMQGPPWSVSPDVVRELFAPACTVTLVDDQPGEPTPRLVAENITDVREHVWLLERQ